MRLNIGSLNLRIQSFIKFNMNIKTYVLLLLPTIKFCHFTWLTRLHVYYYFLKKIAFILCPKGRT